MEPSCGAVRGGRAAGRSIPELLASLPGLMATHVRHVEPPRPPTGPPDVC